MKLYFSPGSCSLSPLIVASELGVSLELVRVDLATKKTADGNDFTKINPKGYVPALQLDDGRILTEGPAIVQYLADQHPEKGLAPKCGTFERAKVQEWLNYIGTELHKNFGPVFAPTATDAAKESAKNTLVQRLQLVEDTLAKNQFIAGDTFTVADAYLFNVMNWFTFAKVDLNGYAAISAYRERISARDGVKKAIATEKAG